MRVLITGAGGQVGCSLIKSTPADIDVVATNHAELDITNSDQLIGAISEMQPDVVINAAAYTAVDRAEGERELAFWVNGKGAGNLAAAVHRSRARLIHISTDFVFDGNQSRPYKPGDTVNPLGVYGASKLDGEQRVMSASENCALILRTAWVYAAEGGNFVKTILRLIRERKALNVVYDQIGTPTWAVSLAQAIWEAVRRPNMSGLHHWVDAGVASWYDFAVAIGEEATALGLLQCAPLVSPIDTNGYPTPARRPAFSVLDCSVTIQTLGMQPSHWRVNLRKMLGELKNA